MARCAVRESTAATGTAACRHRPAVSSPTGRSCVRRGRRAPGPNTPGPQSPGPSSALQPASASGTALGRGLQTPAGSPQSLFVTISRLMFSDLQIRRVARLRKLSAALGDAATLLDAAGYSDADTAARQLADWRHESTSSAILPSPSPSPFVHSPVEPPLPAAPLRRRATSPSTC